MRLAFLATLALGPLWQIGTEWTAAHNGGLLGILLALVVVLIVLMAYGLRRQRTRGDGDEDRRALALAVTRSIVPSSIYTYHVDAASGALVFGWNDTSPIFPLDWPSGGLLGRRVHDFIPAGPAGDEARAAYRRVIEHRERAVYVREDADRHGQRAWIEYRHAPTPDGGGICHAYAVTPTAARADHAEAQCVALRAENNRLRERVAQQTEQLRAERSLRERMDTLRAAVPAVAPTPPSGTHP